MPDSRGATLILLAAVLACGCAAAPTPARPAESSQTAEVLGGMRCLFHRPAAYESRPDWPVILFLHGAGERGRDVELVRREALPRILETLPDFPFVVVSPQEEKDRPWTADGLAALLDEVVSRYRVDRARVYATGLSSGAVTALELAMRHPEKIAAVAPVSPTTIPAGLCAMKDVPAWIFQNTGDERVPPARSKHLARELERCGDKDVKLTLYPRDGHDAWTETYRRKDLYDWFLKHQGVGD
jgi:predicted peptidase